jgi:acyl dehydratase
MAAVGQALTPVLIAVSVSEHSHLVGVGEPMRMAMSEGDAPAALTRAGTAKSRNTPPTTLTEEAPLKPSTTATEAPAEFGPYERSWNRRDCIVYALGVGAGTDELAYTTDTTRTQPQQVIPTFLINQGVGGRGFRQEWIGNPHRTVHAGHRLVIHSSIAPNGTVATAGRVVEVVPKGSGRLVTVEWETHDAGTGIAVATNTISYFVREPIEDGSSAPSAYTLGREVPSTEPDVEVSESTLPTQALLYRCSGDPNVIHTDPEVARAAGFAGPILHGLCTLGFSARAVLRSFCDGQTARFRGVECRFVAPAYPGDTLITSLWRGADGVSFRTSNQHGAVLLDKGFVVLGEVSS